MTEKMARKRKNTRRNYYLTAQERNKKLESIRKFFLKAVRDGIINKEYMNTIDLFLDNYTKSTKRPINQTNVIITLNNLMIRINEIRAGGQVLPLEIELKGGKEDVFERRKNKGGNKKADSKDKANKGTHKGVKSKNRKGQ